MSATENNGYVVFRVSKRGGSFAVEREDGFIVAIGFGSKEKAKSWFSNEIAPHARRSGVDIRMEK